MQKYTLGFIGVGHMGAALAEAARQNCPVGELAVSNRTASKAEALAAKLGCTALSASEVAASGRYVVIGVKPQNISELFEELSGVLRAREDRFVLVSMAAGVTMERLSREAGFAVPVIRLMPNTPVAVGAGCVLFTANGLVTAEEQSELRTLLGAAGAFVDLPETLFDAGSALSGSGPAYVCRFLLALAEAGTRLGIPSETALALASGTLSGTAELLRRSGESPQALCDAVCSPGGSTIEGVRVMNDGDFDEVVAATLEAAYRKNQELGKA